MQDASIGGLETADGTNGITERVSKSKYKLKVGHILEADISWAKISEVGLL